jgi:acetyl-CoA acyltransferase
VHPVEFANQAITAGAYQLCIAGGVESMSRVPMGSSRMGQDPFGPAASAALPNLVPQGVAAELIAQRWGLSRERQDAYAARSHQRAAACVEGGGFDNEIVAVQ